MKLHVYKDPAKPENWPLADSPGSPGPWTHKIVSRAILLVLMLFFLPQAAYLQSNDVFGVTKLIRDVQKRFKLSASDVESIRPLINRENKNVIQIYARFSGDEPEYSHRVWREIIERRRDFEADIKTDLTKRQKAALRAARTGMERRILNYLVEDYVSFLAGFLDLDESQFNAVQELFESENERKYRLTTEHFSNQVFLQTEMEKISRETERQMLKLLSGEQWRDYISLTSPAELIALLRH